MPSSIVGFSYADTRVRRALLWVCILALMSHVAKAQIAVGAGSQSCGQWLEAARHRSAAAALRRNLMLSWVQGYLVGVAEGVTFERMAPEIADRIAKGELPPDVDLVLSDPQGKLVRLQQSKFGTMSGWIFDPPDPDAISGWVDRYCREHPLDRMSQASNALVDELSGGREARNQRRGPLRKK